MLEQNWDASNDCYVVFAAEGTERLTEPVVRRLPVHSLSRREPDVRWEG